MTDAIWLKSAAPGPACDAADPGPRVQALLDDIRTDGETAVERLARDLDGWEGPIVVPEAAVAEAGARLVPELKAAIGYAHDNIRRFAEAQRASIQDFETELRPGLWAGQRLIPLGAAGCYVPGGRYAHIASALMTITTARAAGVGAIAAPTSS